MCLIVFKGVKYLEDVMNGVFGVVSLVFWFGILLEVLIDVVVFVVSVIVLIFIIFIDVKEFWFIFRRLLLLLYGKLFR